MTIFTLSKPAEGEKTAVENAETTQTRQERKTSLSPLFAIALVVVSVIIATVVAGIIVYFGLRNCRADRPGDETVSSGVDMDFERRGWFDGHRFSERCHYDHDNDIVIMDLEGDGFGEKATVVYDFKRGFLTYVLPSKKCFLGLVNQEDIDSFKNAFDGETIELGAVTPRNFTTTEETIPSGYLAQTASPVVYDLCSSMDSHWMELVVDDAETSLSRQKRSVVIIRLSDGTIVVIFL